MIYEKWDKIYREIIKEFNFDINNDKLSAEILNKIIKNKKLTTQNELVNLINNMDVFIFGSGPSLKNSILKYKNNFRGKTKIAADGATSALIENNISPEIIITDLDGKIIDQINENKKGSIVIIHAHGDNIDKINEYVKKFESRIMGTTQANPVPYNNLFNFGGFTDGDRCIFLSEHFNAKKIFLIGYDFDGKIGKYSFTKNKNFNTKIKKLKWCKKLIDMQNEKKKNIFFL